MQFHRRSLALIGAAALACALPASALAQAHAFPSKPVRIVVAAPAGGTADQMLRALAKGLTDKWKQGVVVESKPGAGGLIALQTMMAAPPDGYTLLVQAAGIFTLVPLKHGEKYQLSEVTPIALASISPLVIVTATNAPWNDMRGLLADAKKDPGKFSYASSGIGAGNHFAGENLKLTSGTDLTHIPYTGDAAMLPDIISGRVTIGIGGSGMVEQAKGGRVKVLAVTTSERSEFAPTVPTLKEQGVDMSYSSWFAITGPKGMAPETVAQLNRDINEVLALPETRERFAALGLSSIRMTPPEVTAFVQREVATAGSIITRAKIKLD